LEEADIEKEKACEPLLGGHLGTEFFVVVENQLLDGYGNMVPIQRKLDEVVHHGAISIGEVQPGNDDRTLLILGFAERFPQGEDVLNAARHTRQKSLLDGGLDVLILDQEFLKSFGNNGEKDLAKCVRDGDRAEFGHLVQHTLHLLKQHYKGNGPSSRNILVAKDFEEYLVRGAEDGVAFFVDQIRKSV